MEEELHYLSESDEAGFFCFTTDARVSPIRGPNALMPSIELFSLYPALSIIIGNAQVAVDSSNNEWSRR
jgi:hypothetical protein